MVRFEDLQPDTQITLDGRLLTVISVKRHGAHAVELTYRDDLGRDDSELLFPFDKARLKIIQEEPCSFDSNGALFRLVSEAHRIRFAHNFDSVLAMHTSLVEPLPHQITAVYEEMLPRQPLRFLLADDPGAGKTIMAGLLIKELIARSDLKRCLIVCPSGLVEQWQDELSQKFHLSFDIHTPHHINRRARRRNWFVENDLVVARVDTLKQDKYLRLLRAPDCRWDLVVVDEAHKMSASFFGGEVRYTRRYRLGECLSEQTRHFLLMTATPHNGKEAEFQLFLGLLDKDRFEGRFRDGVHQVDVSDLMRRMVKEKLLTFDGRPLFPERIAYTVPYRLTDAEALLYRKVTAYVRLEFNRAERLQAGKRNTIGFALTVLQRRLASSPEAIYQSLGRRRERLELRRCEVESLQFDIDPLDSGVPWLDEEDIEDLDEGPEEEAHVVLDRATAARTVEELEAEIAVLQQLEELADEVRRATSAKWKQLAAVLRDVVFRPDEEGSRMDEGSGIGTSGNTPKRSSNQKIVIFTEYRATLDYLKEQVSHEVPNRNESIAIIHGGMHPELRRRTQKRFLHDPALQVLLATDAASEGINLHSAHLMVNYDLPWNPNRLEQRFGRIHRIGQTEVCHLWNLVADETREGDVYRTLLEKIEEAHQALGGTVFDVLGKLQFEEKPLRDLLIEAIRYGDQPEVRARLTRAVSEAMDRSQLEKLMEDRTLATELMDTNRVTGVREDMERAQARRLQPHFIEEFFAEAFRLLGGRIQQRESQRYEITHVPPAICQRDRVIGAAERVPERYERVTFEKALIAPAGQPPAEFVCPGHALLEATLDLALERNRKLLRRGTVLVDDNDPGTEPRVLFYAEHAVQDGSVLASGERRTISQRMLYVELGAGGDPRLVQDAPYLDYRPLREDEPNAADFLARPECAWIADDVEERAMEHAIAMIAPGHVREVRDRRLHQIEKTRAAVKDRLEKEITYWDRETARLLEQEAAGVPTARLNAGEARRRADDLRERLERRLAELDREAQISARPPVLRCGFVVVPAGLVAAMTGQPSPMSASPSNTQAAVARARAAVVAVERDLGFEPVDLESERLGYDIESRCPSGEGGLRFIEVKHRVAGATTVTATKNEVLCSLNQPDAYILALVEFLEDGGERVSYLRRPFQHEPDFGVSSVDYSFAELLARAEPPS